MFSIVQDTLSLVKSSVTSIITVLGGEALGAAEVVDLSKQDLQHPVSDTGSEPGQLMAGQTSSVECQTTLRSPDALDARAGKRTTIVLRVVGCVKGSRGVLGEALRTVPGHVLNSEQCSVGR